MSVQISCTIWTSIVGKVRSEDVSGDWPSLPFVCHFVYCSKQLQLLSYACCVKVPEDEPFPSLLPSFCSLVFLPSFTSSSEYLLQNIQTSFIHSFIHILTGQFLWSFFYSLLLWSNLNISCTFRFVWEEGKDTKYHRISRKMASVVSCF